VLSHANHRLTANQYHLGIAATANIYFPAERSLRRNADAAALTVAAGTEPFEAGLMERWHRARIGSGVEH